MKLKKKLLILIMLLMPLMMHAEGKLAVSSVLSYGSDKSDMFFDITSSSVGDGSSVAVGTSHAGDFNSLGGEDAIIAKFDASGKELWKASFGGEANDRFYAVTSKDGYLAAGVTKSSTAGFGKLDYWSIFTVKYNEKGDIVWKKAYQKKHDMSPTSIEPINEGYLLTGRKSTAITNQCKNAYIAILNNEGEITKEAYFGGDVANFSRAIDTGDGYIAFGATGENKCDSKAAIKVMGGYDAFVVKFDKNLKVLWSKTYGGSGDDQIYDAVRVGDGYVFTASTSSKDWEGINNLGSAAVLTKIDNAGNVKWIKAETGTEDNGFDGVILDGEYLVVAGSLSNPRDSIKPLGSKDGSLYRYDQNGNLVDALTFGGSNLDEMYKLTSNQNGYQVVGTSLSTDIEGLTSKGASDAVIYFISKEGKGGSSSKGTALLTLASNKNVLISVKQNPKEVKKGDIIEVKVEAKDPRKKVDKVFYYFNDSGTKVEIKDGKFEMPEDPITIDATIVNKKEAVKEKKGSSLLVIFLILLILAIIGGAGYFGYKYFIKNKKSSDDDLHEETQTTNDTTSSDDDEFNYYI